MKDRERKREREGKRENKGRGKDKGRAGIRRKENSRKEKIQELKDIRIKYLKWEKITLYRGERGVKAVTVKAAGLC